MRKLLLNIFRLYFRHFPIRKGKIPLMILIDKTGLTKNYKIQTYFDNKIRINLNLEDWIQKQVFYFGRYEIEKKETLFWQYLIKENNYVFDIGANIGYYTLQAAARIGASGRVYAFEPVTVTYNKLNTNIQLNSFTNIIAQNLAVSNKKGFIELFVASEASTGSSSVSFHKDFSGVKEKVQTIRIDDYIKENNIYKVDIIKIDVEGCEPMVIEGALITMKNLKPLILIEVLDERLNTINSSKEDLYKLFQENKYSPYEIINYNVIKKINTPKEGGLIIFKHNDLQLFENIKVIK